MVAQHAHDATSTERARYHSHANDWYEYCLQNVRTALDIGSHYDWAIHSWEGAKYQHRWDGHEGSVPMGAPGFSKGSSAYGHIWLWGGTFRNGRRICWTNDQFGDGRITPVTWDFFRDHWGHIILGWSEDLNDTTIPYLHQYSGSPLHSAYGHGTVYVKHLRLGSRDSDSVRRLQHRLKERDDIHSLGVSESGFYGESTRAAVQFYQRQVTTYTGGPKDGHFLDNHQASHLFGDNYHLVLE